MRPPTKSELQARLTDAETEASVLREYVYLLHQNAQPDASTTVTLQNGDSAHLAVLGYERARGGLVVVRYHTPGGAGLPEAFVVQAWEPWARRIQAEYNLVWVEAIDRLRAQLRDPVATTVPLLDWLRLSEVRS